MSFSLTQIVKPSLCAILPNFEVYVGVYFSGNAAGHKVLIEQVMPVYTDVVAALADGTSKSKLHSMIDLDLVAWGNTKYNPNNADNPCSCEDENECYINRFLVSG